MKSIQKLIKSKETGVFKFKPNEDFYKNVGINRKRWGLIYRGEIEPVVNELQRIAEYFKVDVIELLNPNTNNHD